MNSLRLRTAALFIVLAAAAQADESQSEVRLNPEIEISDSQAVDLPRYPFVRQMMNEIELNGSDWSYVGSRFAEAKAGRHLFSVVYLGDSHIQADFGGAVLRRRLSEASRAAGRGLVVPFRLATTNQPLDYTVTSGCRVTSSKLLKRPWITDMPFTGIGVQPCKVSHSFDIGCGALFSSIRVFHKGSSPEVTEAVSGGIQLPFRISDRKQDELTVALDSAVHEVRLTLTGRPVPVYGGFELLADTAGAVVHSIGNNGATYGSYNSVDSIGEGIAALHPDLVIIALGTNEAFGRGTPGEIRAAIDLLIGRIRRANPQAQLLLVGPAECYRRVYTSRRRKGRRRRTSILQVNAKVRTVRDIIRDYAAENGIAYYDHYGIAGGTGAAAAMKSAGVLGRDGVHYTAEGYRLWGTLLADAVLGALAVCPAPFQADTDPLQRLPREEK